MATQEVTITFRGICAHFFNTAPGIPHRVVLPQADGSHVGVIDVGGKMTSYHLPQHLCYVFSPGGGSINGSGIDRGFIIAGVRMQIANAIDDSHIIEPFDLPLPHIGKFAFDYRYSHDVVLGDRARCYFDLYGGTFGLREEGHALHGVARVLTDGPPYLRIERLSGGSSLEVPIGSSLVVGNSSVSCKDASLDFLLHLLTADRGIPEHLPQEPYGFNQATAVVSRERLMERLGELLDLGYPGNPNKSAEEVFGGMYETDASCSNSQWP